MKGLGIAPSLGMLDPRVVRATPHRCPEKPIVKLELSGTAIKLLRSIYQNQSKYKNVNTKKD